MRIASIRAESAANGWRQLPARAAKLRRQTRRGTLFNHRFIIRRNAHVDHVFFKVFTQIYAYIKTRRRTFAVDPALGATFPTDIPSSYLKLNLISQKEFSMPFLLGLATGYVAAILFAPRAGKDMRAQLKERIDSRARERAREIGARAGEMAYEEIKSHI